ncbi:MAG: ABC transporter permease [Alphaproteobacteria bacterium]|nr:ABC transporter permease [Alphaproteobacteria bacterium]
MSATSPASVESLDPPVAAGRRFVSELVRNPKGLTGFVLIFGVVFIAIFAPMLAGHDPTRQVLEARFLPPVFAEDGTWGHILGGDNLGRDILARVLYGSRTSILVALLVVFNAMVVGSILGAIAGYFGGLLDAVIMRIADFQLSFPFILVAILMLAIVGPGFWTMVFALSVALWVRFARLVRGETLKIRELEYIQAAKSIGVGHVAIIFSHVIPNVLPTIIVIATFDVAEVVIAEAAISFLGLGTQPPTPSWGMMISEGRNYLFENYWMALGPGIAIMTTSIAINLFGDFLRDTYDPRQERL